MAPPSQRAEEHIPATVQASVSHGSVEDLRIVRPLKEKELEPGDEEKNLIQELYDWEKQSAYAKTRIK